MNETTRSTPSEVPLVHGKERGEPSRASFRQKVLSATVWSAVCLWGNRILTLLFFAVLTRLLSPDAFGLVALSMVYIGFLTIFQEQGFGPAIIQREKLDPDHLSTAFWMNLAFSTALVLVTVAAAPLIGRLFHEPRLPKIICGLSSLLVIGALTCVQQALLSRQLRFRVLTVAAIIGVLAGGLVGTVGALNGLGVWALVLHQVTARACESLIIWWHSDWRPSFRWKCACFWDLFRFGRYVVGSQFVAFTHTYAADVIIGFFLGSTAVGLFDVAYRCVRMVLQMISGVVARVSLPAFSRLQQQPEFGRSAFVKVTGQIALVSFPVFTGMAVLAPEIVSIVFGAGWAKAVPAMRALSFVGIIQSVCYLKRSVLLAYGKPQWHFRLESLSMILTVTAVLLTVREGINTVAWGQTSANVLAYPVLYLVISRILGIRLGDYVRGILPAVTGSIVMALGILFLRVAVKSTDPHWVLVAALPAGACLFGVVVGIVDPAVLSRSRRYLQAARGKVACDGPLSQPQ